jgi:dipeptidyl aminopeptidase/acylaminoacyl peptidase
MRRRLLLLGLLLFNALPSAAQTRLITHEDVFTMTRTGDPRPSPDGRWVVLSLAEPNYDPAKATSDLWIVPADGSSAPRRLTSTRAGESGVAWSPDSRLIAFSSRREGDEVDQIYLLPIDGGEARRFSTLGTGAANPKWRRDGKALLFDSTIKPARQTPEKSTARVFDSLPIRFWNVWNDGSKVHLFVQPLEGGEAVDWLAGTKLAASPGFDAPYVGSGADRSLQAQWSPDGQEIVFAAFVNRAAMMTEDLEAHLFRIRKAGDEPAQLTARGASYERPLFSPDGKTLVAGHTRTAAGANIYSLTRLARLEWPSGRMTLVAPDFDRSVGDYAFTPDSSALVFAAEDDGFTRLFRVPLAGGAPKPVIEQMAGNYGAPAYAGSALIATYGSSRQPQEVARIDVARGGHSLLSSFNRERLAQLDLPAPEHFWFTAKNGKRIHSVIVFPPGLDRARKYPLIVNPHGGPNAMSSDGFSVRWNYHLLTSPGYVLLATDYTGSTGFGEKFANDVERDVLRGPALEILEAVDEAIRRYPFIDATRQAAIGASYGGYLMNWFNGHTNQFRALVIHAGASNNESQYGVNDGGLGRELRMGAPVWETGKGQWMDQSPFRYAANWRTPSLITQGEIDFRVPLNESMTTFKILQRQGVPSRLVTFPDEGHWILKGENGRHHMQEVLAWLKTYLDAPAGRGSTR